MIDWWMQSIVSASVRGGIALAVVWVLFLIPHVPAAVRCWMWRAAYLVLVASFFWTSPVDVAVRSPAKVAVSTIDTGGIPPVGPARSGSVAGAEAEVDSVPMVHRVPTPQIAKSKPVWPLVVFCSWLMYFVIFSGRLLMGWARARRLRGGEVVGPPELPGICRAMGIRRPPVVRIHPAACGPLLIGLLKPTIVLPDGARRSPDIRAILAHELAHLARLDLLWNWLPTIATALLPIHPMVWIANRRWRLATESACDAAAIAATTAAPADYGRVLVSVASFRQPRVPGVLAVAVVSNSRWLLTRRLKAMTNLNTWNGRRSITAAIVLSITTVVAAVPWRVVAQQPPETRTVVKATTEPSRFYKVTVDRDGKAMTVSVPEGGTLTIDSRKPGEGPTTAPVAVSASLSQQFNQHSGTITAATADFLAATGGKIVAIGFREGEHVRAGDSLYQLEDTAQLAALNYAKADFNLKQVERARKEGLFKQGTATDREVEECRLAIDLAQAQVTLAEVELNRTRVNAPFDGILGTSELQVGEQVREGQKLSTLVQTGRSKVTMQLSPAGESGLRPGMMLDVDTGGPAHIPAVVTFIAPAIDPATGLVTVKAQLLGTPEGLIVGANCEVKLPATK